MSIMIQGSALNTAATAGPSANSFSVGFDSAEGSIDEIMARVAKDEKQQNMQLDAALKTDLRKIENTVMVQDIFHQKNLKIQSLTSMLSKIKTVIDKTVFAQS